MDKYTYDTKNWLEQRFKMTDESGIYFAHQPIYGFRKGHSEPGLIRRYIITYQIMRALSHLKFTSLLDVGGAEGYTAALVRKIFNANVQIFDLSEEACKRASEIYGINGKQVDIHRLPCHDNEFDVVLCSETLEHVHDIQEAAMELIRVCAKAVIITVPHEPKEVVERNIKEEIPHAHIHSLDTDSFNFTLQRVSKVITRRYHNPFITRMSTRMDGMKKVPGRNSSWFLINTYNFFVPFIRVAFGNRAARKLIELDDRVSNLLPAYSGMIFILLKDPGCYSAQPVKPVTVSQIINFEVPYHYLR